MNLRVVMEDVKMYKVRVPVSWNFLRTHQIQEPSSIPGKDESTKIRFAMKNLSCAIVTV